MITNVRIRNKYGEDGGQWHEDTNAIAPSNYLRSLLRDMRAEEPSVDWHLETRGESSPWHRWEGVD